MPSVAAVHPIAATSAMAPQPVSVSTTSRAWKAVGMTRSAVTVATISAGMWAFGTNSGTRRSANVATASVTGKIQRVPSCSRAPESAASAINGIPTMLTSSRGWFNRASGPASTGNPARSASASGAPHRSSAPIVAGRDTAAMAELITAP